MTGQDTTPTDLRLDEQGDGIEVTVGITQLEAFLTAEDPEVREYAAKTLANEAAERPDDVRSAVDALTDRLEDDPAIRSHAAAALSALADTHPAAIRDSVPALTERLEGSTTIRADAADALAAVAADEPRIVTESTDALGAHVTDENERVRVRTTDALAAVADADPETAAAVVDEVAEATGDETAAVRENATGILAAVAAESPEDVLETITPLVDRLENDAERTAENSRTQSGDEEVIRANATRALREIALEEPAAVATEVEPIAGRLADAHVEIRADAAVALAAVAADRPDAVTDVVEPLADRLDDVPEVRRETARALRDAAESDPAAVVPAVPELVERLDDSREDVRTDAAAALSAVASEEPAAVDDAVAPLANWLEEGTPEIRSHGVAAIAAVAEARPTAVEPIVIDVAGVLDDDDEIVRLDAARAIAAVAESTSDPVRPVVSDLADRLDDSHEPVRHHAADALSAIALEAGEAQSASEHRAGSETTREAGDEPNVPALVDRLEEGDEWVRGYAARALAEVASAQVADAHPAVRSLCRRLEDDETPVRRAATRDLVTVATENPDDVRGAVSALGDRLGDDDATVRNNAAIALTRLAERYPDDVREADVLVSVFGALDDADRTIEATVRNALSTIAPDGADGCRPPVAVAVEETTADEERVRVAACEALATLGVTSGDETEAVVDALCGLLVEPTPAVRAAALSTLETTLSADVDAEPTPTDAVLEVLAAGDDRAVAVADALADVARSDPELVGEAAKPLLDRFDAAEGAERRALLGVLTTVVEAGDGNPVTGLLLDRLEADGDRRAIAGEIARLAATTPDDVVAERDRLRALLEAGAAGDDASSQPQSGHGEAVRGYAALALGTLAITGHDDGDALGSALEHVDDRLLDAASLATGGETPTHTDGINNQLSGMGRRLDGDPWAAGLALLALSVLADESDSLRPTGVAKIAAGLEAESPIVRVTAGRVLETMATDDPAGFEEAFPALLDALDDPDGDVRATAAAALAECADSDGGPRLEDAGRDHVAPLRASLADPDGRVRARAVRALAALEETDSLPVIGTLTDDPVPTVSEAASNATTRLEAARERDGEGSDESDEIDWPQVRAGPTRSGHVAGDALTRRASERWRVDLADDVDVEAAPAVVDETVVVGRDDGSVSALALEDGHERWRFEAGGPIRVAPAVVDETVYVGSDDGAVYALDAETGERAWRYQTDGRVRTAPVAVDETVYVGSDALHAIDAETGQPVWTVDLEGEIERGPVAGPTVADETVYVAAGERLFAVAAADGSPRWETALETTAGAPPAVGDGTVYVVAGESLVALSSADGSRECRFDTGGRIEMPPAVGDGTAYVVSSDASVYAVDTETGTERWRTPVGRATTGPVAIGGTVCAGLDDGSVATLRISDGSQLWNHDCGESVSSLAVASGRLCAVGDTGVRVIGDSNSSLTDSISGLFTRLGGGEQ
ncbi:outer membrane protein assembly factor BamB family protein [Natronorubrum sp. FCH18a]|uniref:outer membrane protein assembly factor BamB family protein n=1 Tax=Natronorubrum sp. FCH18a TaxID=3447018 RepID=UPI003F5176D6